MGWKGGLIDEVSVSVVRIALDSRSGMNSDWEKNKWECLKLGVKKFWRIILKIVDMKTLGLLKKQ